MILKEETEYEHLRRIAVLPLYIPGRLWGEQREAKVN